MLELAVVTDQLTKRFGDFTAVDESTSKSPPAPWCRCSARTAPARPRSCGCWRRCPSRPVVRPIVCGYDVGRRRRRVRRVISLTGQFAALEANLTAQENLVMAARLRGFGRERRDRA